jgi:hypothetical protein
VIVGVEDLKTTTTLKISIVLFVSFATKSDVLLSNTTYFPSALILGSDERNHDHHHT